MSVRIQFGVNGMRTALSLFPEVSLGAKKIPHTVRVLRQAALFVAKAPAHRFGLLRFKPRICRELRRRMDAMRRDGIDFDYEGLERGLTSVEGKPMHLSTGPKPPLITPGDIVLGVRELLYNYPSSAHWKRIHVFESIAFAWGISWPNLQRRLGDEAVLKAFEGENAVIRFALEKNLPWKSGAYRMKIDWIVESARELAACVDDVSGLSPIEMAYGVAQQYVRLHGPVDFEPFAARLADERIIERFADVSP